jgi:hypothetical protein
LDLVNVFKYQKLTNALLKEFEMKLPSDNYSNKNIQFKIALAKQNGFKVIGEYYIMGCVDNCMLPPFSQGKTYKRHCDYNRNSKSDLGFQIFPDTQDGVLVRVPIKNICVDDPFYHALRVNKIIVL